MQFGTQRVYVTPSRDRTVDLAALGPAVRAGGGRVVRTRIAARGRVENGAGGARFRIDGWPRAYPLDGDAPPEGPRAIHASVRFPDGAPRLALLDG